MSLTKLLRKSSQINVTEKLGGITVNVMARRRLNIWSSLSDFSIVEEFWKRKQKGLQFIRTRRLLFFFIYNIQSNWRKSKQSRHTLHSLERQNKYKFYIKNKQTEKMDATRRFKTDVKTGRNRYVFLILCGLQRVNIMWKQSLLQSSFSNRFIKCLPFHFSLFLQD